jgi:hypothetical protein
MTKPTHHATTSTTKEGYISTDSCCVRRGTYFVSCGSVFQNLQIYHLKILVTTSPLREKSRMEISSFVAQIPLFLVLRKIM